MNKLHKNFFNKKGFTLTEIVIGLGLLTFVTLATTSFMLSSVQNTLNTTNEVVQRIDKTNAEVQIIKDLKLVFPSFAALNLNDDSSNNFFDILPSESVSIVSPKSLSVFREKTLKNVGDEIIFALYDQSKSVGIPYDPVWAYTFGAVSTSDPNMASTFKFIGLDAKTSKVITSKLLKPVAKGDIFLLDSPAPFKTLSGGVIDPTVPVKFTHYLFYVKDPSVPADFSTVMTYFSFTPTIDMNAIKNVHPITGAAISSADNYLQTLPTVSGTIPILIIRPLKFIKYTLLKDSRGKVGLFRQELEYVTSSFSFKTPGQEVIDNIVEIKFQRPSSQSTQIKVSINQKKETK